MKKVVLFLFAVIGGFLMGCEDDNGTQRIIYEINEPVFMDLNEFRDLIIRVDQPREIRDRGKLCFYNGYLYISEPEKGIHIIDNRNPENPAVVGFIELIGNVDLAIRDNRLFADAYIDLVWFDLTDPANPTLQGRLEDVFYNSIPVVDNEYGIDYSMLMSGQDEGMIAVGWRLSQRKETVEKYRGGIMYENAWSANGGTNKVTSTGVNGSMSRFGLYDNYLYTVINNKLGVFDISGAEPVKATEDVYVGWNVETIFAYKDCMFMGTPTGMLIYSVANPTAPEHVSSLQHVYGCDPVVVADDLAYVTVYSGNSCGQGSDELFIVDVKDVKNPRQLVSYSMHSPKGLGIDNNMLFVCDDGLKVYKITEPQWLMSNQLAHYKGMDGYDVIPFGNVLMMITQDGLYQYDYSDPDNIRQLSKLSTGH